MRKDPYGEARRDFIAGRIDRTAAIGKLLTDRWFRAEVALSDQWGPGREIEAARHVVCEQWTREAIEAMTGRKPAYGVPA